MNFLAHAYLSFDNPEILVGNLIGDFVKGNNYKSLPLQVQNGIILHRKIDTFTDKHEYFKKSVFRINDEYGKYRFVIADLFYDHLLAKHWNNYHNEDLKKYTESVYSTLNSNSDILPEKFAHALSYMKKGNWLYHYQYEENLRQFLGGISRRSKYGNNFEDSVDDLIAYYSEFEDDFNNFFPLIIEMSKDYHSKI